MVGEWCGGVEEGVRGRGVGWVGGGGVGGAGADSGSWDSGIGRGWGVRVGIRWR